MSRPWPVVRFNEILERVEQRFVVDDTERYKCVGIRWYGQGAFIRQELVGADISRKQQWRIEPGDIVYNKLFAWKGAFAVADETIIGCIVSDKFPTYRADIRRVDLGWLKWHFRTPEIARQAQDLSKGAAAISKLTLNPPDFWKLTIPLPPLAEQQRIVACLECASRKIDEARAIRATAKAQTSAVFVAALNQVVGSVPSITGDFREALQAAPRNGWSVRCDGTIGGTPVLTLSAVTGFRYDPRAIKRTSERVDPDAHYWLERGDLLITRSNTPELVGHAAIYDGRPYPCIYPDLVMRCRLRPEKADTGFVHFWLQSSIVREHIRQRAKGTSPTMKKLSQGDVEDIPFPAALTLEDQRAIVSYLDNLQMKIDLLKELQAKTAVELDALLPSILAKAFKGELR